MLTRFKALALVFFSLGFLTVARDARAAEDMEFAPVSVEADKEAAGELEEAMAAMKQRNWMRASMILHRIISRNEVAVTPIEQKAEYTIGKALYRLGLYQASLNFFDRVVQAGPEHRYFKATCKWLYYLSRKLSGDPGLLEKIAKYKPDDCPAQFRSELSFLLGQFQYKKGALAQTQEALALVGPESKYYPKAKFLQGITYVRQEQPGPAVEAFKDLLRVTAATDNPSEDLKYFNQLATLSMARVFYSTGQFRQSVKYYDQIPLESSLWLDGLFEASWAFFRLNNHEKALGNLHTLNSPFFNDEYFPEAPVLASVIFYSNCNYEKTRNTINDFRLAYEPLRDEIKGHLDTHSDPSELYEFLTKLKGSKSSATGRGDQILKAAYQDQQLKRIVSYIRELDREVDMMRRAKAAWAQSELAKLIIQEIEVIKSLAVHEAGGLAKARLTRVVNELSELISQSLKIEFEVTSAEKGILENRLQGAGFENKSGPSGPIYATDDEHIYWPFSGEYWRDELGYYLYTIRSECTR